MLLACYIIITSVVWVFSTILLEMAAVLPLHGGTTDTYSTRFLSKSFGFAMGWNYWYAYAILVPFEITTSTLIIQYWNPPVHDAVFITILLVIIVGLNYMPVASSGEAEFAFSSLKLSLLLGLILLGIILAAGGGPSGDRVGFRFWHDPGAANVWIVESNRNTGLFVSFLGTLVSVVLPVGFLPRYAGPQAQSGKKLTIDSNLASFPLPSRWWQPPAAKPKVLERPSQSPQRHSSFVSPCSMCYLSLRSP